MADSKISQLTESTMGNSDYFPVSRSGANYKLSLTGVGVYGSEGAESCSGKFLRFFDDGSIYPAVVTSQTINSTNIIIGESTPGLFRIYKDGLPLSLSIPSISIARDIYYPDKDGYVSIADETTDALQHAAYQYNYSSYIYNSGDLSLSSTHNGKTIVSTNNTGVLYTVASGLATGYSCSIVQYGTGLVSVTGAAGISVNSYGGLTSIAGQYGSAYINWIQNNSYLLAGNLA